MMDALVLAVEEGVDAIIDIATLTGRGAAWHSGSRPPG